VAGPVVVFDPESWLVRDKSVDCTQLLTVRFTRLDSRLYGRVASQPSQLGDRLVLVMGEHAMPDGAGFRKAGAKRDLPRDMKDRLIVALDLESVEEAKSVVNQLNGIVSFFKLGFSLYIEPGIDELYHIVTSAGRKLFLDAKMFDVPETISRAMKSVIARKASFVTVHGDPRIMRAAVEAKQGSDLKIFAITVLTNLDDAALTEMGYALGARDLVMLRAKNAVEAGCDGIIASADDNPDRIRELSHNLLIATPGIRLKGGDPHDQRRIATPREAILNGADYLVVGRPIFGHPQHSDARSAALAVISEMQSGWDERQAILAADKG
jgi:orotidine-5'-phosphate decarboxylase